MKNENKSGKVFDKYMKICNFALAIFGISPVTEYQKIRGDVAYRVSLKGIIISVMTIILSIILLYIQILNNEFDNSDIRKSVVSWYLNLSGSATTCLNVISTIWSAKSYAKLASSILKYSRKTTVTRIDDTVTMSTKFIFFFLIILFFSFFADLFVFIMFSKYTYLSFFFNYSFEIYNSLLVCHFAVCCFWLRQYLININREIEKNSKLLPLNIFSISCTESNLLSLNSVHPADISPEPSYSSVKTDERTDAMKYLRQLYHQIYLLSFSVNNVFSTRNLIVVGYNFFKGTILIYCGINEVVKYVNKKPSMTVIEIANYFKWSSICFISIYGLIWPSNSVYSEAKRTSVLIQEYFTRVPKGNLQLELRSFIIQLFHEKICFSPHGFFLINNRLLLSIIGAVASYLVILVQFQMTID